MSLFGNNIFGDEDLGQVTLPEPASDELIHELATTGGRPLTTTTPVTTPTTKPEGFKVGGVTMPSWTPYAIVGGGIVVAGVLIWSATRRPVRTTPNRRRNRRRRRTSR